MRGQDELERHVREPLAHELRRQLGEPRERLAERLARRRLLADLLAPPPDAVVLLGGVRELEVRREGPQHPGLRRRRQLADRVADEGGVADLARAARARPDALLGGEERLALLLDEHPAEQAPEQADVTAQRAVGPVGLLVAWVTGHDDHLRGSGGPWRREETMLPCPGSWPKPSSLHP